MISPYITAEVVEELREKIIGKFCKGKCGGSGTVYEKGIFFDCTCVKEFSKHLAYTAANIPRKYWDFSFRNLLKSFEDNNVISLKIIENYTSNISNMIEEGIGLYIEGEPGLAKSSLGCYILKAGVKAGHTSFCIRMSQLSKMLIENSFKRDEEVNTKITWIKKHVSLLMIDEIDKEYKVDNPNSYSGSVVNDFFGYVYDSKKSLIVTSNRPKQALKGIHADNVIDRLEELADIIIVGTSFRGQNETLMKILRQ